jgi:hypothetical protein
MSHVVTIESIIHDPAAVHAACARLGLAAPVHGTAKLFSGRAAGMIVQLPEWKYPVVVDTLTGVIKFDNFGGEVGKARGTRPLPSGVLGRKSQTRSPQKGLLGQRVPAPGRRHRGSDPNFESAFKIWRVIHVHATPPDHPSERRCYPGQQPPPTSTSEAAAPPGERAGRAGPLDDAAQEGLHICRETPAVGHAPGAENQPPGEHPSLSLSGHLVSWVVGDGTCIEAGREAQQQRALRRQGANQSA